ncbi:MAG: trypsin-like peptidase domain-containing protein [Defluviitaleaceae bacterium]|nr:trypsin-like peptidase domain-containing protein [Defluviitaleaceae bacterium]
MKDLDNLENTNDLKNLDDNKVPNFIICDDISESTVGTTSLEEKKVLYPNKYESKQTKEKLKKAKYSKLKIAFIASAVVLGTFSLGAGIGVGYSAINRFFVGDTIENLHMSLPHHENVVVRNVSDSLSMVSAVETVRDSVVSINTTNVAQVSSRFINPFFDNDREVSAAGTGIVFHQDEENVYIVTNEHVIEQAISIEVSFDRNQRVEAFVMGRDAVSDLAVLYIPWSSLHEIDINNVTIAEFGDSSEMQIGEFVMAIGNALGQGIITTMGVVSATNLQLEIDNRLLSVMQTDAAINPGNSGGPLINSRGQVIGINTVKLSRPNVYGMGYSITSNVAIPIMDSIVNQTQRPMLGISGNDVANISDNYRDLLGIEFNHGVFIRGIQRNSGAYNAGLMQDDIITHFDGNRVIDMVMLRELISDKNIGDRVVLRVLRDSEFIEVDVTFVQF